MKQIITTKKHVIVYIVFAALTFLLPSCTKDSGTTPPDSSTIPTLATVAISGITTSSASSGGTISTDGGSSITAKGICYNTASNPTIANSVVISGTGSANFVSAIPGLAEKTKYYVRAYATNSVGTAYGNELSFTTSETIIAKPDTAIDFEGKKYGSVKIESQVWSNENLNTSHFRNGDVIPEVKAVNWNTTTTPAWCYYLDDATNGTVYAKLYNWYAITDSRGLAPSGWHIPNDTEWGLLFFNCGGDSWAGGALKEAGLTHWANPNTGGDTRGFKALPGGMRGATSFSFITTRGYWWSTTMTGTNYCHSWYFTNSTNATGSNIPPKNGMAFSIRCIKD